ncbi:TolC family protein [Croceibacterium mercuriale]|uniref:TolC family protein n=1 Tax=Croceibacterium mercuriale TaxID=1572751 RepID=UPI0009DF75B0|nr:TolC family protein [Croceibacterium mercuriale]
MLHAFRRLPLSFHAALLLAGVAVPHARAQEVYGPPAADIGPQNLPPPATIPAELDRAAALAVTTHPIVNAAEAESEALDAELRGARWLRYPNLGVEALAATRGSNFADRDGLTANIVAEQPLWSGGRISGEIDSANAAARAGRERIGEAARQITIDVTTAYYQQVLGEERIGVLTDSLEQHRILVGSIERRVAQEVSPQVDLTLARSRVAQIELELAGARELQDRARARLLQLTGGVPVVPVLPPPVSAEAMPLLEQAVADGLQCSPTLQALLSQVDAAEARRRVARGELLPQVLFQLSQNEIIGARAALVVRAETGSGLSRLAAIDSAEARIARAFAEFGQAERELREQLQTDYVQLRAAQDRIAYGAFAADTAADLIESYQRQFIAGRRSWLDVMNAVREAANARLSESEARVTAATSAARILALSCRWGPMPTGNTQ